MARNMLRNGIEKFCCGPTRADLSFRPPRLMNCAGAECQAKPSQLLLLTHLIPSANTGDWMAGELDAVNAMRRWTKRVHANDFFLKYLHICLWSLWQLAGRWAAFACKRRTLRRKTEDRTLRQHRFHCHVGKRTDG